MFEEMTFCERLKRLRYLRGFSKKKMADLLEVPYTTYNAWEINREPKFETVEKIAAILEVTPIYLLGWDKYLQNSDNELKNEETVFIKYLEQLGYQLNFSRGGSEIEVTWGNYQRVKIGREQLHRLMQWVKEDITNYYDKFWRHWIEERD